MGKIDTIASASSVIVAHSKAEQSSVAAAEIARQLPATGLAMAMVFVSPCHDPHQFIQEMSALWPDTPVYGCTTAGELGPHGWDENSVVCLGFKAEDFIVAARLIPDLANFRIDEGRRLGVELRQELARQAPDSVDQSAFGLLLIDGMCKREDSVMSAIYASLDDIPVVGGSAGDGMRFGTTWVFADGKAHTDAAVLILVRTALPFRLFKCDNFEPTEIKMVVTEADVDLRVVKELNAEPAAEEYSRAVGIVNGELDMFSFATHPVLVRVGGAYYARSIQRTNPDGSLNFFCAIDEGMVLTAARALNPMGAVNDLLAETAEEIGEPSIYLGFECLFRRLDAEQHQFAREMSQLYRDHRIVGFHTYGEQYRFMHVNQTLTGVAIGRRRNG